MVTGESINQAVSTALVAAKRLKRYAEDGITRDLVVANCDEIISALTLEKKEEVPHDWRALPPKKPEAMTDVELVKAHGFLADLIGRLEGSRANWSADKNRLQAMEEEILRRLETMAAKTVAEQLATLPTDDARLAAIRKVCSSCGCNENDDFHCQCWNDE